MRRADQLHAAFGDRARGHRFGFGADLVDDDHLRHMVLDRFDHHVVLLRGDRYRHAPGVTDAGMRHVAVAGDFVGRIDDHDAFAIFAQDARALAQHRRFAHARTAEQADRLSAAYHVEDDVDRAVHRAPDAAGEADDVPRAIANRADAVQRLLDSRAIVSAERREMRHDRSHVFVRHRVVGEEDEVVFESCFRPAT